MVLIHSINNINGINLTGFTRLGVSADFSTLLKDKKVNSGTFGIAIFIYCKNKTIPYRLDLSSLDMFGNIYSSGLYSS
jgi:hypothetical protein